MVGARCYPAWPGAQHSRGSAELDCFPGMSGSAALHRSELD